MFVFGCVKLTAIFLARCSCKFAAHSSLFHMSIIANTSAAKKQFGTRKCWVWALRGCARLFCTIPTFRIDHSRITELYISTHKLPPKLIIYQLAYNDWNIIILPALGTAIPLSMDQFAGHSPSALVENTNKSFFFHVFQPLLFILLTQRARAAAWLKGSDRCTPVLSHIIPRTNLFRSLTTIVPLIAQAPAIF